MEISVYMIPITLVVAFCAMMIAISYFNSKSRSDKARFQAEVQARLLDKFGTGPEFVQFLDSPQGRKFLGEIESAPKMRTQDRMLGGIRNATVLSFLGAAFLLLSMFTYERGMMYPGFLLLALGLGYLTSVVLTKRLSREWGMFEEHPPTITGIHPPSES